MKVFKKLFGNIFFFLFCALVLAVSFDGLVGNPTAQQLNQSAWLSPFDSSNERGRYALLHSVVEDKSFQFSEDLARFSLPDLAYIDGKFVSLFAPGVSFIVMPGYLVGKYFGVAQLGTFAVVALFALFNVWLIRKIAVAMGAKPLAGTIASLAFLVASPAFAYATSLSQHHISTALLLAAVFLLIRFNNFFSLFAIWFLFAASIAVDYPNAFMMLPIVIFASWRMINVERLRNALEVKINFLKVVSVVGVIIPIILFLAFNNASFGSPFQLSGTLERVTEIENGKPAFDREISIEESEKARKEGTESSKGTVGFFNSRILMDGFYVHFFSPDRGMITYTPIMLLGFLGLIVASRKNVAYTGLLFAVIGINILLYSMWADPYGGWSFGSRYLIPSYAFLSVFIALLLTYWRKSILFLLTFFVLFIYSTGINTLGALTDSNNPSRIEAEFLSREMHIPVKYTYERNLDALNSNGSQTFVYHTYAGNNVSGWNYYLSITLFIVIIMAFLILFYNVSVRREGRVAKEKSVIAHGGLKK
ncbi:MAG: hypothetical protein AAB553_04830 [Patescibacteria group bacterium]